MPLTSEVKMSGMMIIFSRLRKRSPRKPMLSAAAGASQPNTTPATRAIITCQWSFKYQGRAFTLLPAIHPPHDALPQRIAFALIRVQGKVLGIGY